MKERELGYMSMYVKGVVKQQQAYFDRDAGYLFSLVLLLCLML